MNSHRAAWFSLHQEANIGGLRRVSGENREKKHGRLIRAGLFAANEGGTFVLIFCPFIQGKRA
jgi:hypothetical protein